MIERWPPGFDADLMRRSFLIRPTVEVARDLVGCLLLIRDPQGAIVGRIVETEAYAGPDDPASHAAKRRTGLVAAMWGESGRAYVYTSYGLHTMLNVVAKVDGAVGAVLIRALEPLAGVEILRERRGPVPDQRLCAGPGLTCRATGITAADHGEEMISGSRFMLAMGDRPERICESGRVGIRDGTEFPWRFFDGNSKAVSAHRGGIPV
ncbi:MAG TPA: DNA-3-methyladenine glycosylase [Thermomicrobiales bacterium]|nr:DNA-3-methyladenine glycosylase [Thermomicrobiales bacterium]